MGRELLDTWEHMHPMLRKAFLNTHGDLCHQLDKQLVFGGRARFALARTPDICGS